MPLPLNPEMLAHLYDYLAACPPFSKWNMPPSEDVKFSVIRKKDRMAHYFFHRETHNIGVSSTFVGSHSTLLSSMAHEMLHLHMRQTCWNAVNPHDKAFQRYADRICRIHDFDRLIF